MKDVPHHMSRLNRKVVRSSQREEIEEEFFNPWAKPKTAAQQKKQTKAQISKVKAKAPHTPLTAEEKNRRMQERTPVFDRWNNPRARGMKATRKKTPRI